MSDLGRKPLSDQAQEKLTPDSQKSPLDKATESLTGAADNIAGTVQPGDSKSTSQKLSDQTSSTFNSASEQGKSTYDAAADKLSAAGQNIQETVNKNTQQGSSSTGSAEASAKGYLEQAQDLAASALNTASKTAADLANSISGEKK